MTEHNDPDRIRKDIARTRADLSHDVDTLTETANPKNVAGRQADRIKGAARGVRDHVMGEPDDPYDSGTMGEVADDLRHRGEQTTAAATDASRRIRQRTRGNPLAAGLIAFGIGYLVSSAIPSSQREQRMADRLQEKVQPVTEHLGEAAQDMGDRLREPTRDAVDAVRDTAKDAVSTVKQQGQVAVDDVRDEVR